MREVISVYSLWRDSEPHIHRTLRQLEDLESLDYEFEYYFYENDSKDNTVNILEDWMKGRRGDFLHENLNTQKFNSVKDVERMKLLCEYRNKCKKLLELTQAKYTLMLDSDIKFNKSNLEKHIQTLKENKEAVMVTPNVRQNIPDLVYGKSEDSYYDVYPFFDRFGQRGNYFDDCPFKNGIDRMYWSFGQAVKCNSAFGGFALINTDVLKKCSWSTDGECDHVNFCKDVCTFGDILIDPQNTVKVEVDLSKIDLQNYKVMAARQL
ncbi:MAG: glycosyltransferase [Flavobacteriaceae bacterium]